MPVLKFLRKYATADTTVGMPFANMRMLSVRRTHLYSQNIMLQLMPNYRTSVTAPGPHPFARLLPRLTWEHHRTHCYVWVRRCYP